MERISSAHNATLKLARKLLKSSRERDRAGRIVLDGAHLVGDYAKRFGLAGADILVDQAATQKPEIVKLIHPVPAGARCFEVTTSAFAGVSPVDTPTGIVALCDRPSVVTPENQIGFGLLLDGIQDPGNLGSILRTAAATGVELVLLSDTCADAWSPKCLRGGMGAQFVLPVNSGIDPDAAIRQFAGKRIATSPRGSASLTNVDLSGPLLAVFGGEGGGLPDQLIASTDLTVRIPLTNGVESLNVGAAIAMFCYERLRQVAS